MPRCHPQKFWCNWCGEEPKGEGFCKLPRLFFTGSEPGELLFYWAPKSSPSLGIRTSCRLTLFFFHLQLHCLYPSVLKNLPSTPQSGLTAFESSGHIKETSQESMMTMTWEHRKDQPQGLGMPLQRGDLGAGIWRVRGTQQWGPERKDSWEETS